MHRHHLTTVALINRDRSIAIRVRRYFDLRPGATLAPALRERGLGQADLVLCLLRLGDRVARSYVERLIGRPITVAPPCLLLYRVNGRPTQTRPPAESAPARTRITYVAPENPRQSNTDAFLRFRFFQVGRTIEEARMRGATKRDVRNAVRKGWINVTA